MKTKTLFLIVLMFTLANIFVCVPRIQKAEAWWIGTAYVRADGSIDPLDAPIQRDDNVYTLFNNISIGTYHYGIVVERDNITIDGGGYTLQGNPSVAHATGISLIERKHVTIKNIHIVNFWDTIWLENSSNNIITENNILHGADGITLINSSNNTISHNKITDNGNFGIYLECSSDNTIDQNNVTNNRLDGMYIEGSRNKISGNNIISNRVYGILLDSGLDNIFEGNSIIANGYHGGPFYQGGLFITGIGDICSRNIISRNNLTANADYGMWLDSSSDSIIFGNYIANNERGIWLGHQLYFPGSSNTIIEMNTIVNNDYGIRFHDSSNNTIFHNNFINNTFQVALANSVNNIWDDGYPSGGNYWSDYTGFDVKSGPHVNEDGCDGIGDSQYWYFDDYPLMGMFSDFNATSQLHVQAICNSSISDFQYGGSTIRFNVSGEEGTDGFCRLCIPTALINGDCKVLVNDAEVAYRLLPCSNSTHSYLYFTYAHSTKQVVIEIPELPPLIITPLFMITTLLILIACIRKKNCTREIAKTLKAHVQACSTLI